MLTNTSETAIRALIYLALHRDAEPVSQRQIAREINASTTYLAKTLNVLVKAGILQSQHGAHGGVSFAQEPSAITLRSIVEACQGIMLGNYCAELAYPEQLQQACAFHQAMHQVFQATVRVMEEWTLERLAQKPGPIGELVDARRCKMDFICKTATDCRSANHPAEEMRS